MLDQIHPLYGDEEIDAVTDYLESGGWLTEHTETATFQREIEEFLNVAHCRAAPSGTMALYLAFLTLSRRHARRAVVPAFTMYASAIAPTMAGREVVFVDIDRETLGIDVAQLEDLLARDVEISEVVIVHINGRQAMPYAKIKELMEKYPRTGFIEDACQAFGSQFDTGEFLGTAGDLGCFSFSPHKIITTGQGGAIVTNDSTLFAPLSIIRDFGRVGGRHNHVHWGTNLRFTDFQAVFGRAQLRDIQRRILLKKAIFGVYRTNLRSIARQYPGSLEMIATPTNVVPWYVDVLTDDSQPLRKYLAGEGIGTQDFYPPVPTLGDFKAVEDMTNYPVAEEISARGIWLPSSLDLTLGDIKRTTDAIRKWFAIKSEDGG